MVGFCFKDNFIFNVEWVMNIRRYYIENAIYFITCVTYQRGNIFKEKININLFWENLHLKKMTYKFKLYAYVLMYDHFHWLIKPEKGNISKSSIKHLTRRDYSIQRLRQ